MKRKWNAAAVGMVMLIAGAMTAQAEIQDPTEYMGDWYANYLYEPDYDMTVNIPGVMECSIIVTFNEDGTMIQKMVPFTEEEEEETVTGTWELKDNQIIMDTDDEQTIMDEMDGEVIWILDEGYYIMGREEIVEEVDLYALLDEMGENEDLQKAEDAKENPYLYDPEKGNQQEIIAAYLENKNWVSGEFEVTIDEEQKTFTADYPGDEYSEAQHYEGTYEITEDNYINAQWKDETYDYDVICNGEEYVQYWDKFTVKEDLSNLEDVIAAMLGEIDYGYEYTAESLTMTEDTENEGCGTIVASVDDHEYSCSYEIVQGGDPLVKITYYNEYLEGDMVNDNHNLRTSISIY